MLRFVFALLVMASSCYGQIISTPTVWKKSGSPYTITGSLALRSTLTIEAGVEVRVATSGRITFWTNSAPVLIINGTESEPVVFRSSNGTQWQGFNVPAQTSRRAVMRADNAIFRDLGAGSVFALWNGDIDLFNCEFYGVPTIPAGNIGAGTPSRIGIGGTTIGTVEQCHFEGFGSGITLAPGLALLNCDFANIPDAIRVQPGRTATISALGL